MADERETREYRMPPKLRDADGAVRRVGFELEFTGLSLADTSAVVVQSVGGRVRHDSSAEHTVVASGLGEFSVEVDWDYLKRKAKAQAEEEGGEDWTVPLRDVATLFVPVEVVCPPIPIDELSSLDALTDALREAGAQGTGASAIAAYGVHINTEIPQLEADTVHRYLRAFCLLQWWLMEEHDIDTARRLSPYVDAYPEAYLHSIHALEHPSMKDLLEHYLEHNPTRNRALDMLPLFAEFDEAAVQEATSDRRINARPTFHYRLPDCRIDDPQWGLALPWNRWCVVEELANDEEALEELSIEFRLGKRALIGVSKSTWIERVEQWLRTHGSA